MPESLTLGISPCPNDTFIFHALLHGLVDQGGNRFSEVHFEDVETLNEWALAGRLDVTKISYHAYGLVRDRYALLGPGGALGRGCGPLLVCRQGETPDLARSTVAIPGVYTTAAMLLRLFAPHCTRTVPARFDTIMPLIAGGGVDAGVIIHESRFTYPRFGLQLVQDLGQWWEKTTGHLIPLGAICARRDLGTPMLTAIEGWIRQSIRHAMAHPEASLTFIREHAQEMETEVIRNHIALYVNDYTIDPGTDGREAVVDFLRCGERAGLFPPANPHPRKREQRSMKLFKK